MKQHLISLKIHTTMRWPKVDLNVRSHFSNGKMYQITLKMVKVKLYSVTHHTVLMF